MKTIKNVLIATTRQFNPGDEFILMGTRALLRSIIGDFNTIIFNRNPELLHRVEKHIFNFQVNLARFRFKKLKPAGYFDNSFKEELLCEPFVDLAVFAGTPGWAGSRMKIFYEYLYRHRTPSVFLGIGSGDNKLDISQFPVLYQRVIKNALLITARDEVTTNALAAYEAHFLPCPALLAAGQNAQRNINEVKKIGLIYETNISSKHNRVNQGSHAFLLGLYKRLLVGYGKQFDFEFVCHYVNEIPQCLKDFPERECRYSYDAVDYIDIYKKFDLVIGPRVHGIGLAASLGIPGICIIHDARGDTCRGFGADVILVGSDIDAFFSLLKSKIKNIADENMSLLQKKDKVFAEYKALLTPILLNGAKVMEGSLSPQSGTFWQKSARN